MSFLDLANNRYTTKEYNPELKIKEDKIQALKEILRMSPSSINSQPWKFIFISDEDMKNRLASVSLFNDQRVRNASHLVVFNVIDNISKFEEQIKEHIPARSFDYYAANLKSEPENNIRSWLAHQVYLSLGFFLSACATMEIDSTPMEGIDVNGYAEILQLTDYKPLFAVAIGYRDTNDVNQPSITPKKRLDITEVIQSI